MKIGIITPFDSSNMGAFLQAYCLKIALEREGHDVFHVRTRGDDYVRSLFYQEKPTRKKDILLKKAFLKRKNFGINQYNMYREEQKCFHIIELGIENIDLYILGSDEIWNVKKEIFRKNIFWGVGLNPVISYATSIGDAAVERFKEFPEQVNAVKMLSSVLVRDKRTKQAVETYAGINAQLVCDPTLLISTMEYGKELVDEYIDNHDCLLIYSYWISKAQKKEIKKAAAKLKLKTVACCFQHDWCDYQCNCSPLQFSNLIKKCKAVYTTTFHGTIFSILNHANFISVPTSPKTKELLEKFHLTSRSCMGQVVTSDTLISLYSDNTVNYDWVERKILDLRECSLVLLREAINKAVKNKTTKFNYQICPSDACTGCFACMNQCPKEAISCMVDAFGRTLPKIHEDKCIKCGMCKKVCPQNTQVSLYAPKFCYAAQRCDLEKRKYSASGGISAVLAEKFIENGGIVFGAAINNSAQVEHRKACTLEEAEAFRTSKYVQSYVGTSYKEVKQCLNQGKKVLFTGTPCQIAGLRNFLGKWTEGLYTIDIICHGVPPMEYLLEHAESVVGSQQMESYSFRGGDNDFIMKFYHDGQVIYSLDSEHDLYFRSFLNGVIYRENCYHCKYTKLERCSDLTIGDFWGLDRESLNEAMEGNISVILHNTAKGNDLINLIRNDIVMETRECEEAVRGNPQLRQPTRRHPMRKQFLNGYVDGMGFEQAIIKAGVQKEVEKMDFRRKKWRRMINPLWLFTKKILKIS